MVVFQPAVLKVMSLLPCQTCGSGFLHRPPAALLLPAAWAPHCSRALGIPSHSAGFVRSGLGVRRLPLAEGTQVISAMENCAVSECVVGEDSWQSLTGGQEKKS